MSTLETMDGATVVGRSIRIPYACDPSNEWVCYL